jgi:hypothetical protein
VKSSRISRHASIVLSALAFLAGWTSSNPIYASTLFDGVATDTGAGIGTNNVILTLQNTGTESGCIGWNGSADVVGATACPGGLSPAITGGNEKTGSSQTQTRSVSATGIQSGKSLVIVLGVGEVAGNLFTVQNLSLTIYSPTGTPLFSSGNMLGAGGSVVLNSSQLGQGDLGFGFVLDAAQADAASPFICTSAAITGCAGKANAANGNNRIGLAALLTNTAGGNEVFSVADSTTVHVPPIPTPEPSTLLMLCSSLSLLGLLWTFRARA